MKHRNSFFQTESKKQNSKRILIIEHSESLSTLYKSILLQNNYTILTAPSGQEALTMLESFNPNLIITPETLSDMDSTTLQRYVGVRNIGSTNIPVLVLSTKRKPLRKPQSPQMDLAETLHIPFKIADLRQSVEILMGNERADAQSYYYPCRQPLPQMAESISA